MLFELLEAFQVGKEAGNVIENLYNGDHYDAVDKAYEMAQSLDVNDHYNEGVQEILEQLKAVDKNDRAFVRAAAYYLRACCYSDLGEYAKARQNITACLNIQIDSFTLEKDQIKEHQRLAKELRSDIDRRCAPQTQPLYINSNDRRRQKKQQIQLAQSNPKPVLSPNRRKELIAIIADCEGVNPNTKNDKSVICTNPSDLKRKFQQLYNIEISKSKLGSVNTYAGMIDIVGQAAPSIKPRIQIMGTINEQHHNPQLQKPQTDSSSLPFSMPVGDVFEILGRGIEITGTVATGRIKVGDVILLTEDDIVLIATVTGCEMFGKLLDGAEFDDNVGLLLSGISLSQVKKGMMATAFDAEVIRRKIIQLTSRNNIQGAMAIMKDTAHLEGCHVFYFMMAKQHLRDGLFQNALDCLNDAEKIFPANDNRSQALIHFDKGRALCGLQLYDEAKNNFTKCLSIPHELNYEDKKLGISGSIPDLAQLEIDKIDSILSEYSKSKQSTEISEDEKEYLIVVKETLENGEIGPRERRLLDKLASKLGISPERVAELEATLSAPMLTDDEKEYLEEVQAVLADGEISEKERRLLEKLRRILNITEDRAKEIEGLASHRQ